ncbi:hypothetical protein L7F22_046560 [Adiantum nelumboides]|nr:hypothetical protein [Adiantum nelumboides]
MLFGAIHFMRDAPCCGAIQLFSVLIYFSKGERFDGYGSFSSSSEGPILDESLLDIEYKIGRPMDPRDYLQEKKTMLINKCINLYCTEGLMVIDAYSNGFVSRCALKERREVMGLVESIKEREELHSKLLSFATSDRQVKEWANIVEDLQTAAQDQQQAIESSTSETQLVLENKTPPSKPFDPRDDESENEDEDQTNIVKGLEGVQVNKPNLYNNDDREYRQKLLINDTEGSHGATEHQLQPILVEAEVHEDASTLARQPSSSLQDNEAKSPTTSQKNDESSMLDEFVKGMRQMKLKLARLDEKGQPSMLSIGQRPQTKEGIVHRCKWCDSTDHGRKDCDSFLEALKKKLVFSKDGKIHLTETGLPIGTNFGLGGMKKLVDDMEASHAISIVEAAVYGLKVELFMNKDSKSFEGAYEEIGDLGEYTFKKLLI